MVAPVRALDNLSFAVDLITNQTVWNFSKINEFATPIRAPSLMYKVPGTHGGYDPLGYDPNWMDPVDIKVKFLHYYVGSETFASVKQALWQALGNRAVMLYLAQADGTTCRNVGKLTDRPNDETVTQKLSACEFELTFRLDSPFWKGLPPPGALFYDNNQRYDSGLAYDQIGSTVLCTGTGPWALAVTNAGNAPEYEAKFNLVGPLDTPITVGNTQPSTTYPGGQMQFAYYGPNLASGDNLLIDTGLHWIIRNGAPDVGNFVWGAPGGGQREWFRLDPGVNNLAIQHSGGATGGSLTVNALDTWVI